MTAIRQRLESVMSGVLTLCAIVVAASVVYRTFVPQAAARDVKATEVSGWEQATSVGYVIGSPTATIKLVEIADLQCPACRGFQSTAKDLLKAFPGKVSVTVVPYPLSYHEYAMPAARAGECAAAEGKVWEWINIVYAKQDSLGKKSWGSYARDAGLRDTAKISLCAADTTVVDRLEGARRYVETVGITGTPTIIMNGWKLPAPPSIERLKTAVEAIDRGENPFARGKWKESVR